MRREAQQAVLVIRQQRCAQYIAALRSGALRGGEGQQEARRQLARARVAFRAAGGNVRHTYYEDLLDDAEMEQASQPPAAMTLVSQGRWAEALATLPAN